MELEFPFVCKTETTEAPSSQGCLRMTTQHGTGSGLHSEKNNKTIFNLDSRYLKHSGLFVYILSTPNPTFQKILEGFPLTGNVREIVSRALGQEFPGSPVVRTLHFHCPGPRVRSLVRELRSHKLQSAAKKQS